jgi:mannose-6-phosphate isomerase-like protein (cupin superfamily)
VYVRTSVEDGSIRKNNCDVRQLYPWENVVTPPWNSTICVVHPRESSAAHSHGMDETFIILSGTGHVQVGDERRDIAEGDVLYIPGDTNHILTNTSDSEPVKFVSIYWTQGAKAE